jgi:cytochrome c oxidase subunit III
MANTVQEPPPIDVRLPDQSHSGNGGPRNLVPADGHPRVALSYSPPASSSAIWVVLFAISMMFAAFTSALIVRKGASFDWWSFTLPPILYFNTVLLIASSVTLEVARRRIAVFMGGTKDQAAGPALWLYLTLLLGLFFVVGQYVAWLQLRAQGLYLATNPSSSFFYLLTAVHAIHVLGGLTGLIYIIRKLGASNLRRSQLTAAVRYWHFMGLLWLYLLFLLWMQI